MGRRLSRPGRRLRFVLVLLGALATAAMADDDATTLRYQGFVAGVPVGEATVSVSVGGGRYRVEGSARSNGWLRGFTDWRNRFRAHGRLAGPVPAPTEFTYTEQDRDKRRTVMVRDGMLQVTKNGKRRPKRPSALAPDVVTALFVQPRCQGDQTLHTGRHVYRLSQLNGGAGTCRYAVVDDDGDRFEVEVTLAERGELVVPERITVSGWLTGRIELVEP